MKKETKVKNKKEIMKMKIGIAALAVVILITGLVPSLRSTVLESLGAIYGAVLVTLTNKDRSLANLSELKVNPILEKAAQMKADDMAKKGYFAHNTPEGMEPWYWFEQAGYDYRVAGENLAVNFTESQDVETAWMNSTGHRLNILNPRFEEIGIATSTGFYKGREAVFVVQLFGTPIK